MIPPLPPAASAPAQAAPPAPDWPVSALVVSATRGPVFWRAARGAGEVWILGAPEVTPRGLKWDARRLRRLLSGARALLTPPAYTIEGARAEGGAARLGLVEPRLPPALAMRFAAARSRAGRPADRYADLPLAEAAHRLRADLYAAAGLVDDEPDRDAAGLAGRRFLPVRAVVRYRAPPLETPGAEARGASCVAGALEDAAFAERNAEAAGRAWAIGDLPAVRDHSTRPQVAACLADLPVFRRMRDALAADVAHALEAALDGGGRTVAVLSLAALLDPDGVLSRLRADGVEVTAPEAAARVNR